MKTIVLPRQARDKHRESSTQKRDDAFSFPLYRIGVLGSNFVLLQGEKSHTVLVLSAEDFALHSVISVTPSSNGNGNGRGGGGGFSGCASTESAFYTSASGMELHCVELLREETTTTTTTTAEEDDDDGGAFEKVSADTPFLRCHFSIKTIILPRQARDKHRES
jgi:hypothetical protein